MVEITIEKLIELTGDLKDNQPSAQKFRSFISSSDVSRTDLKTWMNECLEKTGSNFNRALQDIVNCIGERLGFQVEYGLYVGRGEAIGYDGKWSSPDAKIQLVIDTKKSGAYRIDPGQIGGYIQQLRTTGEMEDIYGLFVVGEEQPSTVVNTIRGSQYRNSIRVVPLKSLVNLLRIKEEAQLSHTQIVKLLVPIDTINIGEIIELIEDIVETRLKEEAIETPTRIKVYEERREEDLLVASLKELSTLQSGEVVICPSKPEGKDFLLKYNAWGFVHISRKPEYFALYVTAPESKISFFGEVKEIIDPSDEKSPIADIYQEFETYKEGKKLIMLKAGSLRKLKRGIPLGSEKGKVPYSRRYVLLDTFVNAKTLDDL
jgi:hypothetical protein